MKTCIFTVIKDEQEYIQEFIEHHLNLGVDALFIFEDINSTSHEDIISSYKNVHLMSILDVYDDKERIINRKEKRMPVQSDYIQHGIRYIKSLDEFDWCFSIDCDEYIRCNDIEEALSQFNDYQAVILYWKNHGANGHILKPSYTSIQDTYTQECGFTRSDYITHAISKMAINLRKIDTVKPIPCHYMPTADYIRTDYKKDLKLPPCYDLIYIDHYTTKSFEEYMWKLKTRGMICKIHRKIDDFFELNPDLDREECMRKLSYSTIEIN